MACNARGSGLQTLKGESMAENNVRHLWGTEFSVVPEGLSEGQVVSFVNDLIARSPGNGTEVERHSSLVQLAEKTILEAHKLADSIKEKATRDAEAEAERITKLAHETAREQAARALESAQREAEKNANAVAAQAENQAQQITRKAHREAQDILQAAKQQAADIASEARLEAEYTVRKLTSRVSDELRAAVATISSSILPDLDAAPSDPQPTVSPRKTNRPGASGSGTRRKSS